MFWLRFWFGVIWAAAGAWAASFFRFGCGGLSRVVLFNGCFDGRLV